MINSAMIIDNKTEVYFSASSMPSNFGVTIYNHLFTSLGLNKIYIARSVVDARGLIEAIQTLGIKGCSVSMPLKSQVISHLHELDDSAKSVCSVNTISNNNGVLYGFNTDTDGFQRSIESRNFKRVLIYGTGSVVDSLVYVLVQSNVEVIIHGRNSAKVGAKAKKLRIQTYKNQEYDLFINATPLSVLPLSGEVRLLASKAATVYDLVVKNSTYLSEFAKANEIDFISGFEMYKHQFVSQFHHYTGIDITPETVGAIANDKGLV